MKVLFLGGKNIGCGCLKLLIEAKADIVGIMLNPSDIDKERWYASAAELGLIHNIPVFMLQDINSEEGVACVKRLAPDLIIVVYYDKILKKQIIEIPRKGCINLHMALAEKYRGCYPTTWALINGEKQTGVTLHYIDEGIDSGDIVAQKEITIEESDTGLILYNKCTQAGIQLFAEHLPLILTDKMSRRKQVATAETRYYKRDFPSRKIEFTKSGREIYNNLRALIFDPFPPPFFYIGAKKYIIKEEKDK